MIDPELKQLEAALKLMTKYRIDTLDLANGIKITKSIHVGKSSKAKKVKPMPSVNTWTPDQLLYTAAGNTDKKIPQESFNRYGMPHMINLEQIKDKS